MKRKFFSVLFALVLLAGLSLVPAVAMGQGASTDVGFEFGEGTNDLVDWSTEKAGEIGAMGDYSVYLENVDGVGDTYVEFTPPSGITFANFETDIADAGDKWSFWNFAEGIDAHHAQFELKFTDPASSDHVDIMFTQHNLMGAEAWIEVIVDKDVVSFLYWGPEIGSANPDVLQNFTDLLAGTSSEGKVLGGGDYDLYQLTRVRVELYEAQAKWNYVDDITIDDTLYELEPMVLDAEYHHAGGTVDVRVMNGNLNTDPMAIDEIIISAKSTTDTLGDTTVTLTETGSDTGVFTGPVNLVAAPPADREADEIVVSAVDTVTVTYTDGDWGAGAQTIVLTGAVDDTAPVITIESPGVSANITEVKPLIEASYTDGSGVDNATAVMTLNGDPVVGAIATTSGITYTPADNLTDRSYLVTVAVSDVAGNPAVTASWSFTVDTVAPVITGQVAEPGVIPPDVATEVVFTATVTDGTLGSGVATVTIDVSTIDTETALAMLDDDADGIYTANITATIAAETTYLLPVKATDEAGNNVSDNITLVVSSDTTAPVITLPAITYEYGTSVRPGDDVTISANVTDTVGMGTVTAACTAFTGDVSMVADGDIWTGTATVDSAAGWGDYTVTITAADAKGNDAIPDESLTLVVVSGVTGYELELVEGWNLISLPLIPDDSDISVVISVDTLSTDNLSSVTIIRAYDPATGEFPYYVPDTGSGGLAVMEDGCGYWVFMNEDATLTITGRQWPGGGELPRMYPVVAGWNLIGFKSLDDMSDEDYLVSLHFLAGYEMYPVLWSYDAEAGAYENVKEGTMLIGHGFWIWMVEPNVIVPPE